MSTHGEIQEHHRQEMHALLEAIDHLLNGDAKPKKVGFAILMFDFAGPTSDRINYISNSNRQDMICAMKELVARFEGRHPEETQSGHPKEVQ